MGLKTSSVQIRTPDGSMPAHLAEPVGDGPFPSVVVLMEAFGLVPHMKAVAERVAREGYVVIAPDLYYRELPDNKVGYDQLDRAIALMSKVDDGKFLQDMGATLDFLAELPSTADSKPGVMGFCMGGRLAFLSACALPERIGAAAPFYGGGIAGLLDQAGALTAPTLLFFGDQDAFIPMEQVHEIDGKLSELGKDYTLKVYEGANHGFFCDERESYHEAAAGDAWSRLKSFLSANLAR